MLWEMFGSNKVWMIYSGLAEKRVVCSEPEMCYKWCTLIEACAQSLGASDIWRGSGDLHWLCVNNCCNLHCREMSLANCSEHLTKHVCVWLGVLCISSCVNKQQKHTESNNPVKSSKMFGCSVYMYAAFKAIWAMFCFLHCNAGMKDRMWNNNPSSLCFASIRKKRHRFIKSCSKILPLLVRHTLANVPKHSHPRSART